MKKLITTILLVTSYLLFGQCPNTSLFDLDLSLASTEPVWINCIDNVGVTDDYTLDLISPDDILNYSIDWGDGSALETGSLWSAGSIVSHDYSTLGIFTVEVTEIQNGCSNTIEGTLISDRKPGATATPPTLNTSGCVPHVLSFINQTTNVSQFTEFIWDWGDGTTDHITNSSQDGAVGNPINHIFQQGSSGCGMSVTLTAMSLCDTAFVIYGPYDFYDIDTANVSASAVQICVGDSVTFDDISNYNCIPGTRRVMWDLSDFGGVSTGWLPAIPANRTQKFYLEGTVGTSFTIGLLDSNFCGVDRSNITVDIVAPPSSGISVVDDSICEGDDGQFDNLSSGGDLFIWDWGDGDETSKISTSLTQHTYENEGDYEVRLITDIANSLMCTDTSYAEIHVSPTPEVSFSTTEDEGCDELITTFTNTSTSPLTGFQWTFYDGANVVDDSVNKTYTDKGYYIPTLLGTNSFGCQTLVADTVVVLPQPKVVFNDDSLCFGESYITDNRSTIESFPSGTIFREIYTGISGNDIEDLENSAKFNAGVPDETLILTEFSSNEALGDNYGSRVRGFIQPQVSGVYKFFVAGDDDCDLYLSTSMSLDDKQLIASVDGYTSFEEWDKYTSQESDFIELEAGQYYYIELQHKQGGGGGHISVGWQLPNGLLERPIPGDLLTPYFEGLAIESFDWDFGDGSIVIEARDTSYIYPDAGDYYVKLTASSQSCQTTDSLLVRTAEEIIDSLVFLDTAGCTPFELQIIDSTNVNKLTYVYGSSDRDTIDHVLGDTFSYTYFNNTDVSRFFTFSATLESDFSCQENVIQTIEVYPGPSGALMVDVPFPPCAPFQTEVNNTAYDSLYTYNWQLNDVDVIGDSTFTILSENTLSSLRTDKVSLHIESENGCTKTVEETFNVFPEPMYELVESVDSGCSPFEVQFGLDQFAQSYFWEFGDGSFSSASNPANVYDLISQDDSVYQVTVSVLSPFSCPDTIRSTIYVKQNLNANFVATPSIQTYPDTTVQLFDLSTGAIQNYQWIISGDTIDVDTASYAFSEVGDHVIQLTTTNTLCESTHIDTVTILPPVPTSNFDIGDEDIGCENAVFQFNNLSLFADSYIWYFGDGETSTEENPTHSYATTGVYSVSLKVTGVGGTDSLPQINLIEIIDAPVSDFVIVADTLYNPDSTFSLVNNSSGTIDSITWISGDGDTTINENNTQFSYQEGAYTAGLIVSNSINNCIDTSYNDLLLLPPLPNASFIGSDTACGPLTVSFTNTSSRALFVKWDFGDGTVSFESNPTHTYSDEGNYHVQLFASNLQGEDSITIFNNVVVTPSADTRYTVNQYSKIYPDTIFEFNKVNFVSSDTSIWTIEGVDTIINTSNFEYGFSGFGEQIVELEVRSEIDNCVSTFIDTIEVIAPIPVAGFEGGGSGCLPIQIDFTNTTQFGETYLWDFGDGFTSTAFEPSHVYATAGSFEVTLEATNTSGESRLVKSSVVTTYDYPTALFTTSPATDIEITAPSDVFFNNRSIGATSYIWDFGDETSSDEVEPLHYYEDPGLYYVGLIAINDAGCTDTFLIDPPLILIEGGSIFIPNAFSPNLEGPSGSGGDIEEGLYNNDIFFPKIKGVTETYKMYVFNRWGEMMFYTEDRDKGWDGYYNQEICKQDVYVYKVEVSFRNGKTEILSGDFALIR